MPHTECLSRSSRTVLNLLDMYASTSSLTCGSYSMYTEKESFPSNCDLIAVRERLASAQRVPAIPISPGAMSYSVIGVSRRDKCMRESHTFPTQSPSSLTDPSFRKRFAAFS